MPDCTHADAGGQIPLPICTHADMRSARVEAYTRLAGRAWQLMEDRIRRPPEALRELERARDEALADLRRFTPCPDCGRWRETTR